MTLLRAATSWTRWTLRAKVLGAAALVILALIAVVSFFVATGLASAYQARQQFQELRDELSGQGFADFQNAQTYRSLSQQFKEAESSAGRARSRLGFVGLFTWTPVLGGRIEEAQTQLDLAFYLARAGHGLASSYEEALVSANGLSPDAAGENVRALRLTDSLENARPVLAQVERDLEQARGLRQGLDGQAEDNQYALLLDKYLPQIQTLAYISSNRPSVIAQGYELNLDLSEVRELVADPLQVLANAASVDATFARIIHSSQVMGDELAPLRLAAQGSSGISPAARQDILETIELMERGTRLLEQSTAGAVGLLGLARSAESDGLFSEEFAVVARESLRQAETGLLLAKLELDGLRSLLATPGDGEGDAPAVLGFASVADLSLQSLDRVDGILDRAAQSAGFMKAFLGYEGRRSYLLLAQNQQEIRATGGFIGAVIRVTLDQGELVELDFQDSTTVDLLPPAYSNNPLPPDPLYWYLWMGRLLFRDANWSPNFPTSAANVADIYRLGQGGQVDGVFTGSKALLVDFVDLLGDIRVPDHPTPLTRAEAEAFTDGLLPYPCSERHVSTRGKRCFDEDAFFAVEERLTSSMSSEERAALVRLLRRGLKRGNILAHMFDGTEGALLWELGWNGAIPPVDHDYLLVIDSSLPGHSTQDVQRRWEYQVSLQVGRPIDARLRVRYDHQGAVREDRICRQSEPVSSNCFWNYFRVYVPRLATNVYAPPVPLNQGAEKLIWGYPDPDSLSLGRDADVGPARLTEIGGFITVAPNSVTTIPLEYQVPWETVRSTGPDTFEYRLLLQKQSGIDRDIVYVAVEVPAGAEVLSVSPTPNGVNQRWRGFEFLLDTDKEVVVSFRMPNNN